MPPGRIVDPGEPEASLELGARVLEHANFGVLQSTLQDVDVIFCCRGIPVPRDSPNTVRRIPASKNVDGITHGGLVIDQISGEEDHPGLQAPHLVDNHRFDVTATFEVEVRNLNSRHSLELRWQFGDHHSATNDFNVAWLVNRSIPGCGCRRHTYPDCAKEEAAPGDLHQARARVASIVRRMRAASPVANQSWYAWPAIHSQADGPSRIPRRTPSIQPSFPKQRTQRFPNLGHLAARSCASRSA